MSADEGMAAWRWECPCGHRESAYYRDHEGLTSSAQSHLHSEHGIQWWGES